MDKNSVSPATVAVDSTTGTLGKTMALLELVTDAEAPLRFVDILARSGQPRGTLHRQLSHLVEEGLLELGRDSGYVPGLRLLQLASKAWARNEFRAIAEPHLRALHERTGETVHMGILRGSDIIYLDKVESRQSVRMHSQIGNASPAYCTGVGKAALSMMENDNILALMENIEMVAFTTTTHVDIGSLLREIADIRAQGYAFDREEHEAGIRCVAAPFRDQDGDILGGISVTGPAYRVTMEQLQAWAKTVQAAAVDLMDDMRTRLGPRGAHPR